MYERTYPFFRKEEHIGTIFGYPGVRKGARRGFPPRLLIDVYDSERSDLFYDLRALLNLKCDFIILCFVSHESSYLLFMSKRSGVNPTCKVNP